MGDNYFLLTNLLSEDERKVITSITAHIERGEKRVGIQQIAAENYLSTASIVKMCKRLGFDGYSELYYHLSRQFAASEKPTEETLRSLIDNYSADLISRFCALLHERRRGKIFTTGEGFSNIVGAYIVQRMSICGFMAFSNVHFYDYMIFQEAHQSADADESAIMFAVSQSGETELYGITTIMNYSGMEEMMKVQAVTDVGRERSVNQDYVYYSLTETGSLPNLFFGHIILIFEELMARFFSPAPDAQ